jgi:phosphopantothenoylcysteine decarboxylase/phosphopantothenate--cysteine ligase
VEVIEPDEGALASRGEHGTGRLPQPEALLARVEAAMPGPTGPWDGLHVLVTAGGTREAIDSVRFIGNRSSGRMGVALAEAAAARGARVTLIAANVSLPISPQIEVVAVESAAELADASRAAFPESDVLLMAAAVADFRPEAAEGKIVREGSGGMELHLTETEDVVAALATARRPEQTLVGFAAEHGADAIPRAHEKLERKGLDAIVFNDISRHEIGFDSPRNEVTIVTAAGERAVPETSKEEVADSVLDEVSRLRSLVQSKSD